MKIEQVPDQIAALRPAGPICLSFFSGAMGLDLGLEQAGIHPVLACEIDPACRAAIIANRPRIGLLGDCMSLTASEIRQKANLKSNQEIDIVVGGPPCQTFSTAGRRKSFQDSRGNLLLRFVDLICELRPRFAVIENVRGLLSAPLEHVPWNERQDAKLDSRNLAGGALAVVLKKLANASYGVSFNLYNAANFGAPQIRERVILICDRSGQKPAWLAPTHSESGGFGLPKWRTLREAIGDLRESDQIFIPFPEKRLRWYRMLKEGQNWRDLPVDYQKEALGKAWNSQGGKTGFLRRLAWDKPSPTLVTSPAMPATDLAHPVMDRPLSIQEYKRIQEFPDDWILAGNLRDQYRQIGNAVPVSLGAAIGRFLLAKINDVPIPVFPGFRYSRYLDTSDTDWKPACADSNQLSLI